MTPGSIHLHIDELVLDGFDPADRYRIADAVERELATLITFERLGSSEFADLRRDQIDAGAFGVRPSNPAGIGRDLARSLHHAVAGAVSHSPAAGIVPRSS